MTEFNCEIAEERGEEIVGGMSIGERR